MSAKIVVIALLLAILASLASSMIFLVKDPSRSRRTVRALTIRITLSVLLLLFLVLSFFMGWIQPHGLNQ